MLKMFYNFYKKFLLLKAENIDDARREFILNIILGTVTLIVTCGIFVHIWGWLVHHFDSNRDAYVNNTIPFFVVAGIDCFFIFLYVLSRRGFFIFASYLLIGSFFTLSTYMTAKWGIDLPSSNLFYVLIIIISGILINTRFAIIVTVVIGLTMSIIGYLQHTNVLFINNYWKQRDWSTSDIVMTIIVYIIIATVSWLSNREIEKSLVRAQKSEAELKKERDSLAEIVKQKTKEIRAEQAEKISQFYRFAEIGRLSSGLFHDLISPLTSLSLNIEKIKTVNPEEVKPYLDRSILMVKKMDEFITSVRKQIIKQENKKVFCLNEEIRQVIDILSYKILREKIEISFVADKNNIKTFGDIAKFDQIVLNLLTNAIEAYDNKKEIVKKEILVNLKEDKDYVIFTIKDYGVGISEEISNNLFEPFFTTKNFTNGLGIGLPMVKSIVEKDFLGEIKVESLENIGTKFIVKLKKYEQPIS